MVGEVMPGSAPSLPHAAPDQNHGGQHSGRRAGSVPSANRAEDEKPAAAGTNPSDIAQGAAVCSETQQTEKIERAWSGR